MSTYLAEIVASHRRRAAADGRDLAELVARALEAPLPRSFRAALRAGEQSPGSPSARSLAVVAEVKRRSPSKGALAPDLDPASLAVSYAAGGAACLSVLTDEEYFGGSAADLAAARDASGLPVLRKDFTVCEADVCDARLMGADAVLLIVAALSQVELATLVGLATLLGLDALVETHDEEEVDRALDAGARLVGVNQRDLETFAVDPDRAARLAPLIPPEVVAVAESGICGPDDVGRIGAAGYDAVLVGETLVTASDPEAAVRSLCGVAVSTRPTEATRAAGMAQPAGTPRAHVER
jgi:indole-3-glycerol phosphate synthase